MFKHMIAYYKIKFIVRKIEPTYISILYIIRITVAFTMLVDAMIFYSLNSADFRRYRTLRSNMQEFDSLLFLNFIFLFKPTPHQSHPRV